jgi:hypothetical protein
MVPASLRGTRSSSTADGSPGRGRPNSGSGEPGATAPPGKTRRPTSLPDTRPRSRSPSMTRTRWIPSAAMYAPAAFAVASGGSEWIRGSITSATVRASPGPPEPHFRWYGRDFGRNDAEIGGFLASYFSGAEQALLRSGDFRIEFTRYDWFLNSQRHSSRQLRLSSARALRSRSPGHHRLSPLHHALPGTDPGFRRAPPPEPQVNPDRKLT